MTALYLWNSASKAAISPACTRCTSHISSLGAGAASGRRAVRHRVHRVVGGKHGWSPLARLPLPGGTGPGGWLPHRKLLRGRAERQMTRQPCRRMLSTPKRALVPVHCQVGPRIFYIPLTAAKVHFLWRVFARRIFSGPRAAPRHPRGGPPRWLPAWRRWPGRRCAGQLAGAPTVGAGYPAQADGLAAAFAFAAQPGAAVRTEQEVGMHPPLAGAANFGVLDVLQEVFFFQRRS